MKLYATTTSERATKGQGGNDFLIVDFYAHDKKKPVVQVELYLNHDINNYGDDVDEWVLTYRYNEEDDPSIIAQGHAKPTTKGKKKKDETMADIMQSEYEQGLRGGLNL